MRSSLGFQMSLHLGSYLMAAFGLMEVALLIYKAIGES